MVTLVDIGETYQIKVDNVNKRQEEVCAQSLYHLAHNGTHVDSVSPRRYIIVCTSGHVNTLEDSGVQTESRQAAYWYVKDLSDAGKPVYSNYIDGTAARGSLTSLWKAALVMPIRGVMRDRGYSFPLQNVALDAVGGIITGQSVRHIGQEFKGTYARFYPDPYHWFSTWSTNGIRDNSRWMLTQHMSKGHNSDWAAIDWYADTCWRTVYINDDAGFNEFGSIDDLKSEIRNAHRLRVTIDDVSYDVSNARVDQEVVTIQLLDAVVGGAGPDKHKVRTNAAHHWIIAHTTGTVRNYEFLVGSSVRKQDFPRQKRIVWHVDTRPWRRLLRTEDQGRIVEGSPFLLRQAVEQGATIRVNIELDSKSGDFLTEPENIRVDELNDVVYAQALNHLSDEKSQVPGEYEVQNKAFFWYLMISSEGTVRMSGWFVGKDEQLYDERAPSANITWFANF
nr:hypothetical protein BaRGS_031311 [Batillaria attramentaria]